MLTISGNGPEHHEVEGNKPFLRPMILSLTFVTAIIIRGELDPLTEQQKRA